MKDSYTSFLLYLAESKARKGYKKSYEICSKILDSKNAKPHQKKTAVTIIHKIIRKLTNEEFENYFKKINQMIDGMEDDFSMGSLLFNISISTAFYEKISRNKENSDVSDVSEWLFKADQYFINSEPKHYDIHYGYLILVRLNTYLYLEKYEEIIDISNKFLHKYTGSMLKDTINIILFFKAKAYAKLNQIQEAYEIYQNIISYFSVDNALDRFYLFHMTHDYGKYFESINQYERSLEYYNKSLSILKMLDKEYQLKVYQVVSERLKAVEKLLKS